MGNTNAPRPKGGAKISTKSPSAMSTGKSGNDKKKASHTNLHGKVGKGSMGRC